MQRYILTLLLCVVAAGVWVGCYSGDINIGSIELDDSISQASQASFTVVDLDDTFLASGKDDIEKHRKAAAGLIAEKKYAEAEKELNALIKLAPKDANAYYDLARVLCKQGKKRKAIHALTRAVNRGFSDSKRMAGDDDLKPLRKYKSFGKLLMQLRRAKPITIPMAKLTVLQKQVLEIRKELLPLFKTSDYSKCKPLLAKILKLDPDDSIALYNLACVQSMLGDKPSALKTLSKAIDKGYAGYHHMERDSDLDAIRNTKQYKVILKKKDAIQKSRAEKILATLRKQYGDDYICEVDHENKLVFATNVDSRSLGDIKSYLTAYAKIQWRDMFQYDFEQYVTIIIPKNWKMGAIGGYYMHSTRTLRAKSAGMVLTHEFTHALHFGDQDGIGQRHPIWIAEGLATLFETSSILNDKVIPRHNKRLAALKYYVSKKKTIPFGKFAQISHPDFMKTPTVSYSQCRYMMWYLHEKNLLRKWYDAYKADYADDPTGIKAMEAVCGKKATAIEKDWKKWVLALKIPPRTIMPNQAYIGVRMKPVKDGLELIYIVPGSGADEANLEVGDIIVKFDDQRVVEADDLLVLVTASDVGDTITVDIRRDGEYISIDVTLGALPSKKSSVKERTKKALKMPKTQAPKKQQSKKAG